jgi:predicted nucleic-acid-binding protein
MIGIDTNVLVRFLVKDDPSQDERARALLAGRSAENPAFVSAVTLAETVWILHRRLKLPIAEVVATLRELLASKKLIVEHAEELGQMLHGEGVPRTALADYLITWTGAAAGCSHTVTFDPRATKSISGMELLA